MYSKIRDIQVQRLRNTGGKLSGFLVFSSMFGPPTHTGTLVCFAIGLDVGHCVNLWPQTFSSVSYFSPGEVPDTREALLSAFKRLDNDISLEAQVSSLSGGIFLFFILRCFCS